MRFVLVHSPLVGPATWNWVAEELQALGHDVAVPDLTAAAQAGEPRAFVDAARSSVTAGTDAVVGHSGAGFFLPHVAASQDWPIRLLFVDAGVPPCTGTTTASADYLEQLRHLAVDGVLPRWSRWWGDNALERLVPETRRRDPVDAELPEVPLAFYETAITMPEEWCRDLPGAFVLLSDSYREDAARAKSLGWTVTERLGAHLDIVNAPDDIARILVQLAT